MALAWMPLVAVLAGSAPTEGAELLAIGRLAVASSAALEAVPRLAPAAKGDGDAGQPACVADVCQPRVSVPGYEPRLSIRGKRTELAAHLLDRANLQPLASLTHLLVVTGLRFDYTPAALDRSALATRAGGWGSVGVTLRWRVDASLMPVWSVPR